MCKCLQGMALVYVLEAPHEVGRLKLSVLFRLGVSNHSISLPPACLKSDLGKVCYSSPIVPLEEDRTVDLDFYNYIPVIVYTSYPERKMSFSPLALCLSPEVDLVICLYLKKQLIYPFVFCSSGT